MRYTVFDLESDELLDKNTLIHCLCFQTFDNGALVRTGTLTNYQDIVTFMAGEEILVGHNIIMYDVPTVRKILGINVNARLVDTLALSWYLYPHLLKHGLEEWGDYLGIAKPIITDWKNLSLQDYIYRCKTDVEINVMLFKKQITYLNLIYQGDVDNIINYLGYKQDCMLEQWYHPLKINVNRAIEVRDLLMPILAEKRAALESVMPLVPVMKKIVRPKVMYKKDGSLSSFGEKWYNKSFEHGFDPEISFTKIQTGTEPPNAGASQQVKDWLYSLGWEPTIFDYKRDKKTGSVRAVPQISDKEKNLCPNIAALIEEHPEVEHIKGMNMVKHRLDIVKGFIECADENGYVRAETLGFTNTLRFKHSKPVVNLPTVQKPYGKEIRSCIIAPDENHIFCGSDMVALEDTTKQHYIYFYDPDYVIEMRQPGFDPHISMGVFAGMITKEDEEFFKWYEKTQKENHDHVFTAEETTRYKGIVKVRKDSKQVNFSAVYGVGADKLSRTNKWPVEKSKGLLGIYWERNKAVKQTARDTRIRVIFKDETVMDYLGGQLMDMNRNVANAFFETVEQMWLYNPVSGFYYSLRYPKDIFSTLNQGTGVFCFDTQVRNVRKRGVKLSLQYHDEKGLAIPVHLKDEIRAKLNEAIQETNNELKLNVPLGISVEFGPNYAECH